VKVTATDDLLRTLHAFRWRMRAANFLGQLIGSGLIVGAALVLVAGFNRWVFRGGPLRDDLLLAAAFVTISGALLATLVRRRSLNDVASAMDELGKTRDRLVSALAFAQAGGPPSPMRALAEAECRAFISRTDFRRLLPIRIPRDGVWLVVPIAAVWLLQWDAGLVIAQKRADAVTAQLEIRETLKSLDHLAKQTKRLSELKRDAELRELAEQMKTSVARLRTETNPEGAQKAALRELSALEQALQEMQRQPSTLAEMKELAKALAPLPGMEDVLDAINRDTLADAARALESTRKSADAPSEATEEQVRDSLQKALERLSQQRQLSAAMQKLAEQLREGAGSQSAAAMEQLRQMLEQMQQRAGADPQSGSGGGQQMTIEQLIAALQNMKAGEGAGQPLPEGSKPGEAPRISIEAFGPPGLRGEPQPLASSEPTGQAGTERDSGTSATPFGKQSEPADKGAELALKGRLAEGESLSMMLPAAGDTSKSTRRYKELYDALAPAAENAVQQENIPLGSRFYIRRYFESIRPQE